MFRLLFPSPFSSASLASLLVLSAALIGCDPDDGSDAGPGLDGGRDAGGDAGMAVDSGRDSGGADDASTDSGATDGGPANRPPEGSIDAPSSATTITAGEAVMLEATCVDPDGDTPLTHAWDFDGGAAASSDEDPGAVTFATPGTFVVTYTCSDPDGLADASPATVTVRVLPANHWQPIWGDAAVDDRLEVSFVDLAGSLPGALVSPFSSPWPANADVDRYDYTAVSHDGHYFAFLADVDVNGAPDLYLVDLYAATPVAVNVSNAATASDDVTAFLFSPDSQRVAYVRSTGIGSRELRVADLSAGLSAVTTTLAHPAFTGAGGPRRSGAGSMSWSSDSSRLFFIAALSGDTGGQAYVHDPSAPGLADRLHPFVDGTTTALFVHAVGASGVLVVAALETAAAYDMHYVATGGAPPFIPVRLNPTPATALNAVTYNAVEPQSSYDDTRVTFTGAFTTRFADELFYADLSGPTIAEGSAIRLHDAVTDPDDEVTDAVWSPTSNHLVFRDRPATGGLTHFVDVSGAAPLSSVEIATRTHRPSWAPDGSGFVVVGFEDPGIPPSDGLFFVDTSSGTPSLPPTLITPAFVMGGRIFIREVRWRSSTEILFVADAEVRSQEDVFLVDRTSPGSATRLNPTLAGGFDISINSELHLYPTLDGRLVAPRINAAGGIDVVVLDPSTPSSETSAHPPVGSANRLYPVRVP